MRLNKTMSVNRLGIAIGAVGAGTLLVAAIASSGDVAAQNGSPLIGADIAATIVVAGGDAQGGDAIGGDAGLTASISDGGGSSVYQSAELLEGGSAVGGDATGGDGVNAFIDAEIVLDADIGLNVAADVDAQTVAGANLNLSDLPLDSLSSGQAIQPQAAGSGLNNAQLPAIGNNDLSRLTRGGRGATGALPNADLGGLQNPLGALGGLAGLNLLDLTADLNIDVRGGAADGGNAQGGDAVLQAVIEDGAANVTQKAGKVYGGDATGGDAIGGDGIELDILLDADIDLVVDATVDVSANVDTLIEGNVGAGRLGQFQTR